MALGDFISEMELHSDSAGCASEPADDRADWAPEQHRARPKLAPARSGDGHKARISRRRKKTAHADLSSKTA